MLDREQILTAIHERAALEDAVVAMWEGGSTAFGRTDEYSDIDLQLAVQDDAAEKAFEWIESTLTSLSPIERSYAVPEPTWHGHGQRYYQLRDASPYCVVDVVLMNESSPRRYQSTARHGDARVFFDRTGWLDPRDDDPDAQAPVLASKAAGLANRFEMFHRIPRKEHRRGRPVDAMAYYQGLVLRPLVDMLRIKHTPVRHDFGPRYIREDLPAEVATRLEPLYYVADPKDFEACLDEAVAWVRELAAELTPDT